MDLFKTLASKLKSNHIKITVSAENDGKDMCVSIRPVVKGDVSKVSDEDMPQFILAGTPEELDEKFVEMIKTPLERTAGITTNIRFYAENMKKKEEEAKAKAEKKSSTPAKKEEKKPAPAGGLFNEAEESDDNGND